MSVRWLARSAVAVSSATVLVVAGTSVPAGAAGWEAPVRLSASGALQHAAMAGATAVVAWKDGPTMVVAYRTGDGAWETTEVGQGSRPRVAVNEAGDAVATWHRRVDGRALVEVAHRPAGGPWDTATTLTRAGRFPVVALNPTGTISVLALRWRESSPAGTRVLLFTHDGDWAAPTVVSGRRSLPTSAALARSLAITTDSAGRPVMAWLCDFPEPVPVPRGSFVCVRYPGSDPGREATVSEPRGRFALSVPTKRPVYLATPFEISEITPGSLSIEGWYPDRERISRVALDVGRGGAGVASWQVAGADSPVFVVTRRSGAWGNGIAVSRHTHGLSGTTLAEPATALAFWRTGSGRLRTAARVGPGAWQRGVAVGSDVDRARLVSNDEGDAILAWSSAAGTPGVHVASRPADRQERPGG